MRLSPRDPKISLWHFALGGSELEQGHYDAAIDELHKALDAGWRAYIPYAVLAAEYALEGKGTRRSPPWRKLAASIPVSP